MVRPLSFQRSSTASSLCWCLDKIWQHVLRYGSPYIELADTSYIIGGGYVGVIEYKGKGYFSGKSHSFKATLSPQPGMGGSGAGDIVVEGQWHQTSKFVQGGSGPFHDVTTPKEEVTPVGAAEGGEMGEMETRKLWELVAKGIREGDFETASREKSRIEVRFQVFFITLRNLSCPAERPKTETERRNRERHKVAYEALHCH